ncbi:hypothetical protein ANCCAN_27491 [Ancylostoma caninum]|uniref:Uncharacterized protein n=1 Tax=Ancylostoma caninum TaxID=29170 RepID=A0A368F3T9_ANCCA|nr:hypothetical protein ANCCAN_27491 [Ancylostoma caninum]
MISVILQSPAPTASRPRIPIQSINCRSLDNAPRKIDFLIRRTARPTTLALAKVGVTEGLRQKNNSII